jgi:hypothetical protein
MSRCVIKLCIFISIYNVTTASPHDNYLEGLELFAYYLICTINVDQVLGVVETVVPFVIIRVRNNCLKHGSG